MAAPARRYFRDALGRFASRPGGGNRLATRVARSRAARNFADRADHALRSGAAAVFDAGAAEAQRRVRNARAGRAVNVDTGRVSFTRLGRARNRAANRFNTARYSRAGQRVNRRIRVVQRGYRAVRSAQRSRASARQARRITRAALRMNRAYKRAHPSPGAMRATRSYASVGSRARKTTRTLLAKRRR